MAPKAQPAPAEVLAPAFGVVVEQALHQLQQHQLFGRTRAEVIERLVCDRLRDLKREGWWRS